MPLLAEAGIEVPENPESSRKLILPTSDPGLRLIIVRASDVPTYVQYGAADLGIAGKDVLIEHAAQQPGGLYQPIDLNIAKRRLAVAVRKASTTTPPCTRARLRVATKYVQSAREHFASRAYTSTSSSCMVRWSWRRWSAWPTASSTWSPPAARCAPTTWWRSRTSCRSPRLIVNQAALKTRGARLQPLLDAFERPPPAMPNPRPPRRAAAVA